MILSLIVAVADNGVIGRDGGLPWRMPSDMKTFRRLTMGKPIIMGRKQYDSVGRPLEGRDNIVITRNPFLQATGLASGVHVAANLDKAIALASDLARQQGGDEIMVIGGAQIYALALARADRIYLSRILADIDGDVRFDVPESFGWKIVKSEDTAAGPKDEHPHTFQVLDRAVG